ncbi:hypothetical protein ACN27F_19805 [Solwaraspora sp. WMMB335]|uniref:hypothetical protein n=1 Tax=Solwaraspora sp. WMMB335 TaxID=3404118 RepID=UPI003B93AA99
MEPEGGPPSGSARSRPLIMLWAAVPLAFALVLIQIVGPDQPSAPGPTVADGEAVTAPEEALPRWPRPSLDPAESEQTGPLPTAGTSAPPHTPSARPAGSTPAGAPVSTPVVPRFTAVSVEAEAPGNLLAGDAKVADCATCDGGARVQYVHDVNFLEVYVTLPVAGTRTVAVRYESDGQRKIVVQINGGSIKEYPVASSGGWETPATHTFEAQLSAGRNTLRFSGHSPDIDRIVVS